MGKKFDIVIGNPPYSKLGKTKEGKENLGGTKGDTIWRKFMKMSWEHSKKGGFICLVHPGGWRKPSHKLLKGIKERNLLYLEIHNRKDGNKTFNANTEYDWYVLKNEKYGGETVVKYSDGEIFNIDLSKHDFIPNCGMDLINSLIAKDGEEKCPVIYSSKYSTTKRYINKLETPEFKYPCINNMPKNVNKGFNLHHSSTNEHGQFGVMKVVVGLSTCANYFIDAKGEYGMTQWAWGIAIDSVEEGEEIVQVLKSEAFKKVWEAISWSHTEPKCFMRLRRNFYEDFLK